ncbi:MAG: hypothetical protein HFE04_02965 [Bacilli bacterium]|nr:hypothetical protein [Bacilli bacterium]
MANRNIRRKQKINTNYNKINEVEEMKLKDITIVICAIGIIVVLAYGLTILAKHIGLFDIRYIKPEVTAGTIDYENILAGTIFSKQEDEYYVMIGDFESEESVYIGAVGNIYKNKDGEKLPLYAVDLSEGLNKSITGDTSNPSAQSVKDLKINGHTLIKISGGRNVKYVEGDENIKVELGI